MVHNQKQFTDAFRKHGCYNQSFELSSTETSEGFTSLTSALFANQNEVWMDLGSHRQQHMDQVISKLMNDKSLLSLKYQDLALLVLDLIPLGPSSCAIPPLQFVLSKDCHCIHPTEIDNALMILSTIWRDPSVNDK